MSTMVWRDMVPFTLLALQFGLQPTLNKAFLMEGTSSSSLIIMTELIKITLALTVLVASTTPEMRQHILKQATLEQSIQRAGVPAFLYSIQNWLILFGSRHISPLALSLLNQTKTLSAALFAYLIMGKRQTPRQLVALAGLFAGASLIMSAESDVSTQRSNKAEMSSAVLGFAAVALASLLSGLSSAITEYVLQRAPTDASAPREVGSLLFSMELAAFGVLTLLASALVGLNPDANLLSNPFSMWTPLTLVPALTNASGGILVGIVTQRAGGVRKGVSLILGICIATCVEGALGRKALTSTHFGAVVLVLGAMWLYFTGAQGPANTVRSARPVEEQKQE